MQRWKATYKELMNIYIYLSDGTSYWGRMLPTNSGQEQTHIQPICRRLTNDGVKFKFIEAVNSKKYSLGIFVISNTKAKWQQMPVAFLPTQAWMQRKTQREEMLQG